MRICLVFDCLYPHTVGGAERWYRNLAESLAHRGHTVTYLTLLQWDRATGAGVPNMDVVAVAGRAELYAHGRRSIGAQIRFAFGVWRHLLAHGGRYDVVQTPALHVSLLAVLAARPIRRFALVVDWFEVWTREYWLGYLGGVAGRLGWWGQRISARAKHHALCFSRRHARRLEQIGYRGQITLLEGLLPPGKEAAEPMPAELTVVVAAPDNAAVELVEDGVNGFVARSAEPKELGEAILRVHAAGPALRESTADWFRRNRERLSLETSVERVLAVYGRR